MRAIELKTRQSSLRTIKDRLVGKLKERENLGYTQDLYILPFDHRGSYAVDLYGKDGDKPTPDKIAQISHTKSMIYEGFKRAVEAGVPKDKAAILVDEQYGSEVLRDAREQGYTFAVATEATGTDLLIFEYGSDFGQHIEDFKPTFMKALVRYNPDQPLEERQLQIDKLRELSRYAHTHGYKFLVEPLIPATKIQLARVDGDKNRYDQEVRPKLAVRMIKELQKGGVEPDVWKIEGLSTTDQYQQVTKAARRRLRKNVGVIVLGRNAPKEKVADWLKTGAPVDGIIGFAVGRTVFLEPIKEYLAVANREEVTPEEVAAAEEIAITKIADGFKYFADEYSQAVPPKIARRGRSSKHN